MLFLRPNRSSICSRKRNENVTRAVAGVAAVSPQTKRYPPGDTLQLSRNQRSVRCYRNNDRSLVPPVSRILRNLFANWHACDPQLFSVAVIALHQHAHGVSAVLAIEHT